MTESSPQPNRTPAPAPAPQDSTHDVGVGNAPAPVWLFVLLGLLTFWGMHYLDGQGGGFHASVYRPHRSFNELQAMVPRSDEDLLYASGQRLYGAYCSVCHQPGGQGITGQFPPLARSEWVVAEGYDRIIRMVLHGLHGPISVRGNQYNGAMPGFSELRDEEIAAILTYIRQNEVWGNNATAVSPSRVREVRDGTSSRARPWTAAELLEIPEGPGTM